MNLLSWHRKSLFTQGAPPPGVICFEEGFEVVITDIRLSCPSPDCEHHEKWLPSLQFLRGYRPGVTHLRRADVQRLARIPCPAHPSLRLMPVCLRGHELWLAFQSGDHVVVMVGTSDSGKTTLMAALEHRVRQAWMPTFHTTVTLFPLEHAAVYERDIRSRYLAGLPPNKTWDRQYFFFEIGGRGGWPPEVWQLTFYDGPGEVYWDPERAEHELLHLVHARQILFVLDPYLIPNVVRFLPPLNPEKTAAMEGKRAETALEVLVQIFKKRALCGKDGRAAVDLAVVIPKFDDLPDDLHLLPRDRRAILFPEPSPGWIAGPSQLHRASQMAEDLLRGPLGMGEFVDKAYAFFRHVGFFFTAAWGPEGPCPNPQPIGVENPFLWLMCQRKKRAW